MEIINSDIHVIHLFFLFIAGIAAGICNVLAGGGSLLTLPLLIFLGLDNVTANGTNRLAVGMQSLVGVLTFRRKGYGNIGFCLFLALPAIPGTVLGAMTATKIEDGMFKRILSIIMIIVLILILSAKKFKNSLASDENSLSITKRLALLVLFVGIGFYIGFIQAGAGVIVIAVLSSLLKIDLVKTNYYKLFITGILTWTSVFAFLMFGRIVWHIALILAGGSTIGGWLGTHIAILGGEKWVKIFLVFSVLIMSAKLAGLF